MINRIVLVGRLTRDPELKPNNTGTSVCSFTVAVDNRQKNPDGTKSASFIPCTCFQNAADNMIKFLKKGALVGVEGRLNQRTFTRQDGTKGSVFEVICDSVQFLEPKSANGEAQPETTFAEKTANEPQVSESLDTTDDDLPF